MSDRWDQGLYRQVIAAYRQARIEGRREDLARNEGLRALRDALPDMTRGEAASLNERMVDHALLSAPAWFWGGSAGNGVTVRR